MAAITTITIKNHNNHDGHDFDHEDHEDHNDHDDHDEMKSHKTQRSWNCQRSENMRNLMWRCFRFVYKSTVGTTCRGQKTKFYAEAFISKVSKYFYTKPPHHGQQVVFEWGATCMYRLYRGQRGPASSDHPGKVCWDHASALSITIDTITM